MKNLMRLSYCVCFLFYSLYVQYVSTACMTFSWNRRWPDVNEQVTNAAPLYMFGSRFRKLHCKPDSPMGFSVNGVYLHLHRECVCVADKPCRTIMSPFFHLHSAEYSPQAGKHPFTPRYKHLTLSWDMWGTLKTHLRGTTIKWFLCAFV